MDAKEQSITETCPLSSMKRSFASRDAKESAIASRAMARGLTPLLNTLSSLMNRSITSM